MRILILTNLYPNPFQPQRATFNREQIRLLSQRCPVRIIAPIAWTDELAARRKGTPPLPPGRRTVLDGLDIEHPRYLFPPRILRSRYGEFYRRSVQDAFRRAVDEFRPDLIFTPWAYPDGWAAVALGNRVGLPVVIKVHGSDVLLLDQYPGRRERTVEALRQANSVLTVSADLARRVEALGVEPHQISVHYDGVDGAIFSPGTVVDARVRLGLSATTPTIVTIGNLVAVKAQDLLVEACANLRRQGLDFHCYVIGQGPLRSRLERRANGLGLADRVRFLGALPHDQLPDWYRAASVFALPSHSEGVPTVLLEAASIGTPFVASRVGGIPEIAHLGPCHLFAAGDVGALTDGLQRFLINEHDPMIRRAGVVRSRQEAVDELECLFHATLQRHVGSELEPRSDGIGSHQLSPIFTRACSEESL